MSKDKGRYDRQERAIGKDAMKYLFSSRVLVCGLGGLGIETAKNLILMGVREVALHDDKNVTTFDLGTHFFLDSEHSIGKNRAEESLPKLKELNDECKVYIVKGELNEALLAQFTIVIFTDSHIPSLVPLNEMCRKLGNISFIASEVRGVFGSLFVDLGDSWESKEPLTRSLAAGVVVDIRVDPKDNKAYVDTHDKRELTITHHGLLEGAHVTFSNVEGMVELNDGKPRKVESTTHTGFCIGDATGLSAYKGNGYFQEVRFPQTFNFRPLKDCLADHRITTFYDFAKWEHQPKLHIAFCALAEFVKQNGRLTNSYDEQDATQLIAIAKQLNEQSANKIELDEELVKLLAFTAQGQLNPMTTMFGAIVAQEALKAATHKFKPIQQWFYFESVGSLPKPLPTKEDVQALGNRYDGQIIVFGQKIQRKISNLKYFVVGAGALGCEFLKNFALMGVATGANGKLIVTDMDGIEVSNLSRQFLFREEHVKKMKSEVAKQAVEKMNPQLQIEARIDKVAPDTEKVYNDAFWENLDGVVAALDNVEARVFVDSKCVHYKKPFFESGTLGSEGHITTCIPFKTLNYGNKPGVNEKGFPNCTIHEFPNLIQHTIMWAQANFDFSFGSSIARVNKCLANPKQFLEETGNNFLTLGQIYNYLIRDKPSSYVDCVCWARVKFEELFNYNIRNILFTHPPDKQTKTGTAFWSGSKRTPTPLQFNADDVLHLQFVEYAARLFAHVYHIPVDEQCDYKTVCSSVTLPLYTPQMTSRDEEEENKDESPEQKRLRMEEEDRKYDEQVKAFEKVKTAIASVTGVDALNAIQFEKDDDTNYHVDFLTAASNLRARCYKIPEADKHKTKGIAGNIIPAMITTTAAVVALVCLEIYKNVTSTERVCDDYRNGFINIGMGEIALSYPTEPEKTILNKYTIWDEIEINAGKDITLKELLEQVEEIAGYKVDAMTYMGALAYNADMHANDESVLSQKVAKYIEQAVMMEKLPAKPYIVVHCSFAVPNKTSQVLEHQTGPPIKYIYKQVKKLDKHELLQKKLAKIKQQQQQ